MLFWRKSIWRTPEEIVEIGFQRSPVVMMNEAHDGFKRCIRTREIGKRILPTAHRLGVRHLAMEALYAPIFAEQCNLTRHVPDEIIGYPSQSEMKEFIQTALDLGWTLVPYEANSFEWISARYGVSFPDNPYTTEILNQLLPYQADLSSMEFTNWREEQQAQNLITALQSLPVDSRLLVWCGNGHHSKKVIQDWKPMGYQFKRLSGINAFVIDQIRTVKFDSKESELVTKYTYELDKYGGTAGFLIEESPSGFRNFQLADALILSVHNELE